MAKAPVMFVVGKREAEEQTVAIRRLGDEKQGFEPLKSAISALAEKAKPPY
ncbi:MAG TPA: His/Gly/Thr/Pro-type tRNA ligase C-terminal domain-containing protein [Micavibrio sp.]